MTWMYVTRLKINIDELSAPLRKQFAAGKFSYQVNLVNKFKNKTETKTGVFRPQDKGRSQDVYWLESSKPNWSEAQTELSATWYIYVDESQSSQHPQMNSIWFGKAQKMFAPSEVSSINSWNIPNIKRKSDASAQLAESGVTPTKINISPEYHHQAIVYAFATVTLLTYLLSIAGAVTMALVGLVLGKTRGGSFEERNQSSREFLGMVNLGLKFVNNDNPNLTEVFRDGSVIAESLKKSQYMKDLIKKIRSGEKPFGYANYKLSQFTDEEIRQLYLRDANNFLTGGWGLAQTPAITFLGSFENNYFVSNNNILSMTITNHTTIASAFRTPTKEGYNNDGKSVLAEVVEGVTTKFKIMNTYTQIIYINIDLDEYKE